MIENEKDKVSFVKEMAVNSRTTDRMKIGDTKSNRAKDYKICPGKREGIHKNHFKVSESIEFVHKTDQLRNLKYILMLISSSILISCLDYILYHSSNKSLIRLQNNLKIQILAVEAWGSYINAQNALIQTILWNGTSNIWQKPSDVAFEDFQTYISDCLIANFTDSLEYDLGTYTEEYRSLMSSTPACGRIFLTEDLAYFCKIAASGGLNSPFITSLRHISQTQITTYEKWKVSRGSFESAIDLLYDSEFRQEMGFIDMVCYQWYFTLGQEFGIAMFNQIAEGYKALRLFEYWTYILVSIFAVIEIVLVSLSVKDSLKRVISVTKLFPERQIYNNVQLMRKLSNL